MVDLRDKVEAAFGVSVSVETLRSTLHAMGFSHVLPRPLHLGADPARLAAFRKNFRALAPGADDIDVCFQDEARAGRKGMLSRGWAYKGKRSRILRDQRFVQAWLFAAARPHVPVVAGHICERARTGEMDRHLGRHLEGGRTRDDAGTGPGSGARHCSAASPGATSQ